MNGRVYSEVTFILENLEEEYISKVPKKLSAFCIPILYFTHYISFYNKEKYMLYNSAIKNMSFDVISLEIEDKKIDGYTWKFKKWKY